MSERQQLTVVFARFDATIQSIIPKPDETTTMDTFFNHLSQKESILVNLAAERYPRRALPYGKQPRQIPFTPNNSGGHSKSKRPPHSRISSRARLPVFTDGLKVLWDFANRRRRRVVAEDRMRPKPVERSDGTRAYKKILGFGNCTRDFVKTTTSITPLRLDLVRFFQTLERTTSMSGGSIEQSGGNFSCSTAVSPNAMQL